MQKRIRTKFVTEESGVQNLLREGKPQDRIHYVGHVMIDNLLYQVEKIATAHTRLALGLVQSCRLNQTLINGSGCKPEPAKAGLKPAKNTYAFLTLHRPSNVDNRETFGQIAAALNEIAGERPIFFPVHPRTKKMMEQLDIRLSENVISF